MSLLEAVRDTMKKINGRLKRDEKESAKRLIGKPFKCTECEHIEFRKHIEFGEELRCPKCGAKLNEVLVP
jgi:predicted Zn-ribbon and HTH transcriptional regulator